MKMKKPLVSVIMPAYNASLFITSSVQSIKDQTFKNWELIIINDGSTDNTLEILKKIKNRKIKIINQKKNIGPYKSINNHINKCKGKFIAFLDADDVSNNKRLKIQSDFLIKHKNFSLVGSNFKYIDSDGNFLKKNNDISITEFNKIFPCQNCIVNSSVMLRKEIFKEIYFLDKEFFYAYDYIFYLKIFKKKRITILKNYLLDYRLHNNQRTNALNMQKRIIKENIKLLAWSKKNGLVNCSNIFLYYKNFFKNFMKYFILFLK